jgi:hypothetical protein
MLCGKQQIPILHCLLCYLTGDRIHEQPLIITPPWRMEKQQNKTKTYNKKKNKSNRLSLHHRGEWKNNKTKQKHKQQQKTKQNKKPTKLH